MIFYDEIYYEITLRGLKSELSRFLDFLRSGGLDDYFEFDSQAIIYGDNYNPADDSSLTDITLINEDGIAVDEFDVEEFLEVFCQAGKRLDIYGFIYDSDETEFNFTSEAGNDYFVNSRKISKFNDELDGIRDEEDGFDDED